MLHNRCQPWIETNVAKHGFSPSSLWVVALPTVCQRREGMALLQKTSSCKGSILGAVLPEEAMQQPFPGRKHVHPIGWEPSNVAATIVRGINV